MGSRQEVYLYTPEQVANHLLDAAELVGRLDLPEAFEVEAFKSAVTMLSGKHVNVIAPAPAVVPDLGLLGKRHVQ